MSGKSYRNSYRSDRPRYRRGRRGAQESDTIVMALTAQILICAVLLAATGILKKVDPEDYSRIRTQYGVMTTDTQQNRQLAGLFGGWWEEGGVFASLGQTINDWADRLTGRKGESDPERDREAFGYDYLSTMLRYNGAGGAQPVSGRYEVPANATMAPVILAGRIITPVEGILTSPFAFRYHPITGNADFHTGLDIAAEEGRGILAALPGEVVEVGESEVYGKYIIMQHATNLKTFYAHCSEIIAKEGMAVRQGERIALVGQTGTATGPHLHFSLIVDETFTDPAWVFTDNIRLVEE